MRLRACVGTSLALLVVAPAAAASSWKLERVPYRSNVNRGLDGVSCRTAKFCMAVGFDANYNAALAARWDGVRWVGEPTPATGPSIAGIGSELNGVSCPSTSFCIAVGSTNSKRGWTLVDRWDGARWTSLPHPRAPRFTGLNGVSCPSIRFCIAVGGPDDGDDGPAVADRWNGKSWTRLRVPAPAGSTSAPLSGVSCLTATDCIAVGSWYSARTEDGGPLAERWNGSRWSIQPTPAADPTSRLASVSCRSASFCVAVGGPDPGGTGVSLAERWNGTTWTAMPFPKLGKTSLEGVSCRSPSDCTAVGTRGRPLAVHWNGGAWTIQPTERPPQPPLATMGWWVDLTGVSCTSLGTCRAVGTLTYIPGGSVEGYGPVAEGRQP